MPTFYQRPLTWLLVGVFVVLDAAVCRGAFHRNSPWVPSAVIVQTLLFAEWLLRRRGHWLAGLALSLLYIVLAATLLMAWRQHSSINGLWEHHLAFMLFLFPACYAGTLIPMLIFKRLAGGTVRTSIRFSTLEILGLTIAVAIGCFLVTKANYDRVTNDVMLACWLGIGFIAGLYNSTLDGQSWHQRIAGLVHVAIGLCFSYIFVENYVADIYQPRVRAMAYIFVILGVTQLIRSFEFKQTQQQET